MQDKVRRGKKKVKPEAAISHADLKLEEMVRSLKVTNIFKVLLCM